MGNLSELPFLALKISVEDEQMIEDGNIVSEIKPSILNIDFDDKTIGMCFVQIRLNADDKFIYTAVYDLNNQKHYDDCYALLNMKKYGLLVASTNVHDFISYDNEFEADFDPRAILSYAKEQSSDYPAELFVEISYALSSQVEPGRSLWDYLNVLAPYDKSWYGRMHLNKDD